MDIQQKYASLKNALKTLKTVLIAYSGGVDSTFLLKVALDTLGPDNVTACIGISPSLARTQYDQALKMAETMQITPIQVHLDELDDPNYSANKADRCFHCKSHLYREFTEIAQKMQIPAILCGSNLDDQDDYRPGNRAATVYHVKSPLMDSKLTKNDIRTLSKQLKLETAELPASPCLASRVSYGHEITEQKLSRIDAAEDFIRSLGFTNLRVRDHGPIARIEVPADDIQKIAKPAIRQNITAHLKTLGYTFIALDLQGFRTGSLNETLSEQEKRQNL